MAYITKPHGGIEGVKNLGWFLRKARTTDIHSFTMTEQKGAWGPSSWKMRVEFGDGHIFQTEYASLHVFKKVMGRQHSLRGVSVTVRYLNGDEDEIMLGRHASR